MDNNEFARGSFGSVRRKPENPGSCIKRVRYDVPQQQKRRVKREIEFLKRATHPNIVKFYGFSPIRENKTVVAIDIEMEFCERKSFRDVIYDKTVVYSMKTVLSWAENLFSALVYLAEAKIIHRDIKPENVLLKEDFTLKLADFGFVLDLNEASMVSFMGTFRYMSPELYKNRTKRKSRAAISSTSRGFISYFWNLFGNYSGEEEEEESERNVTVKSDLYSAGLFLWEVIERRMVYTDFFLDESATFDQLFDDLIDGEYVFLPPYCEHQITCIIQNLLEVDMEDRMEVKQVYDQVSILNEKITHLPYQPFFKENDDDIIKPIGFDDTTNQVKCVETLQYTTDSLFTDTVESSESKSSDDQNTVFSADEDDEVPDIIKGQSFWEEREKRCAQRIQEMGLAICQNIRCSQESLPLKCKASNSSLAQQIIKKFLRLDSFYHYPTDSLFPDVMFEEILGPGPLLTYLVEQNFLEKSLFEILTSIYQYHSIDWLEERYTLRRTYFDVFHCLVEVKHLKSFDVKSFDVRSFDVKSFDKFHLQQEQTSERTNIEEERDEVIKKIKFHISALERQKNLNATSERLSFTCYSDAKEKCILLCRQEKLFMEPHFIDMQSLPGEFCKSFDEFHLQQEQTSGIRILKRSTLKGFKFTDLLELLSDQLDRLNMKNTSNGTSGREGGSSVRRSDEMFELSGARVKTEDKLRDSMIPIKPKKSAKEPESRNRNDYWAATGSFRTPRNDFNNYNAWAASQSLYNSFQVTARYNQSVPNAGLLGIR